jgi:peroxisomal membrane protein 2
MEAAEGRGGVRGGKGGGRKWDGSLASKAWRQYLLQLQQHPLRTKVSLSFAFLIDFFSFFHSLFGECGVPELRLFVLVCWPAQMITAGCLAGVSDSLAQKLSGYQKIDKRRLLLKMVRTLKKFI